MPPRPIILFDVMETLVTEPFFSAIPNFFGISLDELLALKHPTSWIDFEKGCLSEAEYFATFFRDRRRIDGAGLRRCLQQSYQWMDGMEALIGELRAADYAMHALSNYSIWYKLIDEKLKLSRFLSWDFVSCKTGVRKPDSQAYLGAAAALNVRPQDCLFIDDRQRNVDAARKLGMDAILQTNADDLREHLVHRSILPSIQTRPVPDRTH